MPGYTQLRPRAPRVAGLLLAGLAALAAAGPASAQIQSCPDGRIAQVQILNNSLFSSQDLQAKKFSWALGLANSAHIRTRADYLRGQMLLAEGGCYDPEALAASERFLRELDFIARVQTEAVRSTDSTWVVRVETWDEWSTSASVYFDVESELQIQGFYVTEINALGRGLRLSFRHRDFRERNDNSLTLASTRFLGSPTQASIAAGATRTGHYFRQEFSHPFPSEASRLSFLTRLQYENRQNAYVTGEEEGITHVLLPLTDRTVNLAYKRRVGVPGHLGMYGLEVNALRREADDSIRQVADREFDRSTPASPVLVSQMAPQNDPDSYVRVGTIFGVRRIAFTRAKGLDLISGVQNVALGTDVTGTLGRTLKTWGTSRTDWYGALDGFVSGQAGPVLGNVLVHAEGRWLDDDSGSDAPLAAAALRGGIGSRWRDLHATGRVLLYVQPDERALHTFVTGARFSLARNVDQPFQNVLGGEQGVRGYRDDQLPTGSTLVTFAEERVNLPWFHPAVDVGLEAFGDYGRGWANGVPFGMDTGWRATVGGSLRLAFPAGSGSVTHIQVAWPVGPGSAGHGPVLRTYFSPVETNH
jgi:hypothetical protein